MDQQKPLPGERMFYGEPREKQSRAERRREERAMKDAAFKLESTAEGARLRRAIEAERDPGRALRRRAAKMLKGARDV